MLEPLGFRHTGSGLKSFLENPTADMFCRKSYSLDVTDTDFVNITGFGGRAGFSIGDTGSESLNSSVNTDSAFSESSTT